MQVQKYTVEDSTGAEINPETIIEKIKKNNGELSKVENLYNMLHIIHVRQLPVDNDPNTPSNLLNVNKKEMWEKLAKQQAKEATQEAMQEASSLV